MGQSRAVPLLSKTAVDCALVSWSRPLSITVGDTIMGAATILKGMAVALLRRQRIRYIRFGICDGSIARQQRGTTL